MIFLRVALIIFICSSLGTKALSQQYPTFLSVGTGPVAYKGDLNDRYDKWGTSLQLSVFLNKKKRTNGEFNISVGQLSGQNKDYTFDGVIEDDVKINTFFITNFTAISYNLHVNFVSMTKLKIYCGLGVGLIRFNPKNLDDDNLLDIPETRLPDESYVNTVFALPLQLGFYYYLVNGFGVGFQANIMNSQTDYLDNISQLGNRTKKDNILSYKFNLLIPIHFKASEKKEVISEDLQQQ